MEYGLVCQTKSEIQANLYKGKLQSHGIEVKLDSVKSAFNQYNSQPDTFGIYVLENEAEKAKAILASEIAYSNTHNPTFKFNRIATTVLLIILVIAGILIYLSSKV